MIRDLGIVQPGTLLYIPFHTFDSNDPSASVTITGLATTDIEIYKDGSITQRASDAGYALLDTDGIDFDGTTGIHGISVDLADNTTAGFYAAGSQYWVVIGLTTGAITVDGAGVNFVLCTFRIGYPAARLNTTIATLSSQTSFTLTAGPAEDDALNGHWCIIHDVASAVQCGHAIISDYTGSTKTVTLAAGTTFTAAATDNISIMAPMPMQPTVSGRTLDVSAGGEAGVDWANVGTPGSTVSLTATTVSTVTTLTGHTAQTGDAFARLGAPAGASVSADVAAVKVDTAAILADTGTDGVVVAAGSKTGYTLTATTGLGNQTANITGNLSGSVGSVTGAVGSVTGAVGSVTGAVGSVTGNVGGNVVGSVGSVTGAVGSVTGNVGGSVASVTAVSSGAITEASFATTAGPFAPLGILDQGTMQAGSTSTTAVLRSALSIADDLIIGAHISIASGTGAGQTRTISDWVSSTDTATVDAAWTTTPDNTSVYKVFYGSPAPTSPPAVNVTQVIGDPIIASSGKTTNWGGTP